VVARGVDLGRLLVVRVPRSELPRVAVKLVSSGAFEVVVIDVDPVPGTVAAARAGPRSGGGAKTARAAKPGWAPEVVARKLALAAESGGTTVLLLTDASRPRAVPWPVALRVDLSRPNPRDLVVRVAKDRRGRVGSPKTIPFRPVLAVTG
jgi:recombination protein RecA